MLKRFSLLACSVSTFLLPLASFAAPLTPQQVLDRSLTTVSQQERASHFGLDFDIRYDENVLKKQPYASGSEHVRLHAVLDTQAFLRGEKDADGVFTLRVPHFEVKGDTNQPINVQNPFTLEARVVNKVLYVRVSDVSPLLLAQLPPPSTAGGPDFRALIGTWIKIDPAELGPEAQELGPLPSGLTTSDDQARLQELRALIAPGSVLQVTGVEKRYKNAAGDQLMRLRVRLNPRFIDRILDYQDRQMVKAGGHKMTAKERATAKKELQTAIAPFKFIAVVNATKVRVERFEGAYVKSDALYRYEWKNGKEKKYYNGKSTIDVRFGISTQPIADRAVPVPEPSTSFKTLMDQWKQANLPPEPTMVPEAVPVPPTVNPSMSPTSLAPVGGSDHIRGNPQAPVTVMVYSDYQCPFCQQFAPSIQRLLTEFPQDVRVVYRNYPLSFHEQAQPAAEAAECAGRVGGSLAFWSMHDQLLAQGSAIGAVSYTTLASQIGLNPQAFETCMNNHEGVGKVNQDINSGNEAGVNGTPATFVNGVLVSGAVPYEALRQEVVRALGR